MVKQKHDPEAKKHSVRENIRLAVDIIVFSVIGGELSILLIKRKYPPFQSQYAIPGGFVLEPENLEDAAKRELMEETGVKNIFIKMLGAYGDVNRDPRGRIVSVAFIALIDSEKFRLKASTDALSAEWKCVHSTGKLAFDHNKILQDALDELRFDIQTTNIAAQLLPDKFALSKLQGLYENILGKKLDKRNFRKKILDLEVLKPLNETRMEGAHRPAQLFSFREKKYRPLKEKMMVFV